MTTRKPLTAGDREKYVESLRIAEDRITRRVIKAKFGANDILGSDIISYTPLEIVLDQTTDVDNMSHRRRTIEKLLVKPPSNPGISIYVHGIGGYREDRDITITRHVIQRWQPDGSWDRVELPVPETSVKL